MAPVVTISASFGSSGSIIGPAVADRLQLPFLDRAITVAAAERLAIPEDLAVSLDERAPSVLERFANSLAFLSPPMSSDMPSIGTTGDVDYFCKATEAVLHHVADTTGAVILGRAGMIVLADRVDVLCVRLDGPVEARIARACTHDALTEAEARAALEQTDRARDAYLKVFYHRRANDPRLYHLMIDATAMSIDTCVDLIVTAAGGRFAR